MGDHSYLCVYEKRKLKLTKKIIGIIGRQVDMPLMALFVVAASFFFFFFEAKE